MSRILAQVTYFTLCTAILTLTGCNLDWEKKGDSATSMDGGNDGSGDASDGKSGGEDVEGAECSVEVCNERDDDCDTVIDETCSDVDECAAQPCRNGGTCSEAEGSFLCTCPAGFEGKTCETDIDDCADNPCLNSGVCEDRPNGYTCKCSAANTGPSCELEICGDVVIRSRQDIVANRACAEMHDLTIEGYAFTTVSEFDFPNLTTLTGSLKMETPLDDERGNIVLSVTFAALESIAGDFVLTFSPLREVHFPKLRTIGGSFSSAYIDYTVLLDFPALTTLGKGWTLFGGDALCKVNIANLSTVGGDLGLVAMPKVNPSDVAPLRKAVAEGGFSEGMLDRLGCCYPGLAVNCGASLPDAAGPACQCN